MPVLPGETWTERDVVRAVLLASSNNHADTLVRWAFGGVEPYVEAANAWLAEQGFTATRVDDATGLSSDNVGTAKELARLAAMIVADEELAAMLDDPGTAPLGARNVPDLVGRESDGDVRAITRSFTDQAALSYVFTAELPEWRASKAAPAGSGRDAAHARLRDARPRGRDCGRVGRRGIRADHSHRRRNALRPRRGALGRPRRPRRLGESIGCRVGQRVRRGIRLGGRVLDRARGTRGRTRQRVHCDRRDRFAAAARRRIRDPGPVWRLTNPATLIGAFFAGQGD